MLISIPLNLNNNINNISFNVSVGEISIALQLSPEDFEKRFGFQKFDKNDTVIFYCRSGKRSGMAAKVAEQYGYSDVINYEGSWLDWSEGKQ